MTINDQWQNTGSCGLRQTPPQCTKSGKKQKQCFGGIAPHRMRILGRGGAYIQNPFKPSSVPYTICFLYIICDFQKCIYVYTRNTKITLHIFSTNPPACQRVLWMLLFLFMMLLRLSLATDFCYPSPPPPKAFSKTSKPQSLFKNQPLLHKPCFYPSVVFTKALLLYKRCFYTSTAFAQALLFTQALSHSKAFGPLGPVNP